MTTILKYKDFQGSASIEDGRIVVQVLHIDDFITDECFDAREVDTVFAALVDDYIETCAEVGKEPCRPFKGSFNVRVSSDVHRRAAYAAMRHDQSLNAWVEEAMRAQISKEERIVEVLAVARHRAQNPGQSVDEYIQGNRVEDVNRLKKDFFALVAYASPDASGHH